MNTFFFYDENFIVIVITQKDTLAGARTEASKVFTGNRPGIKIELKDLIEYLETLEKEGR
jgi:hypothetical protein